MSSTLKTRSFVRTSVGKKIIMAITGFMLLGFVFAHMLGNLQVFLGPDKLNGYAKALKDLGGLLWVARLSILSIFIVHLVMAIMLTLENRAARPIPYHVQATQTASYASRTMIWSGIIIFTFLVYHLLHFTLGVTNPEFAHLQDAKGRTDVFRMVVTGFQSPAVSISYIVAVTALCLHISHGFFSAFQSIGFNHPSKEKTIRFISNGFALIIFIGNVSMPLSILLGCVK
jgi:succinate dehydrogenase / fumarate reductase cytochrome b subunit